MRRLLLGIFFFAAFEAESGPHYPVLENSDDELRLSYLCQASLVGDVISTDIYAHDAGVDLREFCRCFASRTMLQPELLDPYASALKTIIDMRHEHPTPFFDSAIRLVDQALGDGPDDTIRRAYLDNLQVALSETNGVLYDNQGQCVN